MKEIKAEALKELANIVFNSDAEWNEEKVSTLYRFYQGNEERTNLHKYVNLVSYEEFKYQLMAIVKELNEQEEA